MKRGKSVCGRGGEGDREEEKRKREERGKEIGRNLLTFGSPALLSRDICNFDDVVEDWRLREPPDSATVNIHLRHMINCEHLNENLIPVGEGVVILCVRDRDWESSELASESAFER